MKLPHWIHHLFNPHCSECFLVREQEAALKERQQACRSCETLRLELARVTQEKNRLLDELLKEAGPVQEIEYKPAPTSFQPVQPLRSWPLERARLERADREEYEKQQKEKIEKLEKETGVQNAERS